jgi:fatty-acyl-CoA synthase
MMLVVLKPEAKGKVEVEDLKAHMRNAADLGQLPKYGLPDRYVLVDVLPKTSVGKLDKKVLRQGYR